MGGNNSQNTMSLAIFLTYYLIYLFMNAHVQAKAFQCVVFEQARRSTFYGPMQALYQIPYYSKFQYIKNCIQTTEIRDVTKGRKAVR
jgi:hypothetical protein